MKYGTAWYPEQWPEARWETDLKLMRSMEFNVLRTGEYAWTMLEPREGNFDLDWLRRAVDLAGRHGIEVILTTPSDAPPAWMTQKYPEVLRVNADGQPARHGARRHFSPVSARYRDFCRRMAGKMAEAFGDHPNVIGWQIGNEFCMWSYDEESRRAFQAWLADRYGSLDELNRRWTTTCWNQVYTAWTQVQVPTGWSAPPINLAYFHFMSRAFADFQRVQIDAIRAHAQRDQWITHNLHATEDVDFVKIIADCDLAGWDPYPAHMGINRIDYPRFGWTSDFSRTLKRRPHWVLEVQPGHVNWASPNVEMPRGSVRGMIWHFLGHGAEGVMYWQWRSGLGAHEQYHGTLLAPDGTPRPLGEEATRIGREMRQAQSLLAGTRADAQAAVIYSYADQFALRHQYHNKAFDALAHMQTYYAPLRELAIETDVIHPGVGATELARYRLLVAPHLHCLDDATAHELADYVRAGGHLLLGPRSGFKTEINALRTERQPGDVLGELLGAVVEDLQTLDAPVALRGELGEGEGIIWADYLREPTVADARVLLRYGAYNGWIDDQPAMVSRKVGKGRISYLGAWPTEALMARVMAWAVRVSGVECPFPTPPRDVEVCRRVGNGREVFVLINHGPAAATVTLPRPMTDALGGMGAATEVVLPAYEVRLLT